jgi:RimJ/RimL family protein N-acetyltransferase
VLALTTIKLASMPILTTERLRLRPYLPTDFERVHRYAALESFSRFEFWGPNTEEDTRRFIVDSIIEISANPILAFQLAVVLSDHDLLIGGCTLRRLGPDNPEGYIGYAIGPDYQNRGFATEVGRALIEFAFDTLGLKRVFAECDARNVASWRVMEKLGMRRFELLKKHRRNRGVLIDSFRYEIMSSDPREPEASERLGEGQP